VRSDLRVRHCRGAGTTKSPASLPGSGPVLGALMSGRCRDRTALARSGSLTTGPTGSEIHAAHAAAMAMAVVGRGFLLRQLGDHRLGGDDQARDRRRVLQGG